MHILPLMENYEKVFHLPLFKDSKTRKLFNEEWFNTNKNYITIVLVLIILSCTTSAAADLAWALDKWTIILIFVVAITMTTIPPFIVLVQSRFGPQWYNITASVIMVILHSSYAFSKFYCADYDYNRAIVCSNTIAIPFILIMLFRTVFPHNVITLYIMFTTGLIIEIFFGMENINIIEFIVHWCQIYLGGTVFIISWLSYIHLVMNSWMNEKNAKHQAFEFKKMADASVIDDEKHCTNPLNEAYLCLSSLYDVVNSKKQLDSLAMTDVMHDIVFSMEKIKGSVKKQDNENVMTDIHEGPDKDMARALLGERKSSALCRTLTNHNLSSSPIEHNPRLSFDEINGKSKQDLSLFSDGPYIPDLMGVCSECIDAVSLDFNVASNYVSLHDIIITCSDGIGESIINTEQFRLFSSIIEGHYNKVPYHNCKHAADVIQFAAYILITDADWKKFGFTDNEILALLIASMCHDADHMGLTNAFYVSTSNEMALIYNEMSVLENHHSYICLKSISESGLRDVMINYLGNNGFTAFKKRITNLILATDISTHGAFVEELELLASSGYNPKNVSHRDLLLKSIMKLSDISNIFRPFPIYAYWMKSLFAEYFTQGQKEQNMGISTSSALMNESEVDIPKTQQIFSTVIIGKLLTPMMKIFKSMEANIDSLEKNMNANLRTINDLLDNSAKSNLSELSIISSDEIV
ncbi:MAG: 3',5'-cyclic nucleotide phosphodiesterase [Candidatus Aenigmarchaeota archaeon]|nr:3',5'-cyclic nucleotide phosphodiesterase [Candidatus Aenigmarchaeota archaeon]